MKGVKRLTPSTYEAGDYVAIVPDSHVFGGNDLQDGRAEESLGELPPGDISKLIMSDEGVGDYSAMALPTFRSLSTNNANLKLLHRRKYQYDGSVKLKSNAQEKT